MAYRSSPFSRFTLDDRALPRIGYGLGRLARHVRSEHERQSAVALLRHAFDLGVRHFDTAQFYGDGLANSLLRDAFVTQQSPVFIATKVGARPPTSSPAPEAAQHPRQLREAVEANLTSLGVDHLDLVYLRRMDYAPGVIAASDQIVDLDDQLSELVRLRDTGHIRAIGLSHVTCAQLTSSLSADIAGVQNIYNVLERSSQPLLDLCERHQIAWTPYFPLGGGGYANLPRVMDDPTVRTVAERLGRTPQQIGLAWQLANSPNTLLIPGTADPKHLRENVDVGAIVLDSELMAELNSVTFTTSTLPV
ncbi:Predicted oxidoreductase [Williamsia sterculiae]|uniref:Predicted oxidoreductase n=2 Tax=Williamsia sterculiae TaxID=1344003 RepID=A0A1N7FL24_9NOCA|nr:Predicted oxidoreductase [Williamsia sterculiae]